MTFSVQFGTDGHSIVLTPETHGERNMLESFGDDFGRFEATVQTAKGTYDAQVRYVTIHFTPKPNQSAGANNKDP